MMTHPDQQFMITATRHQELVADAEEYRRARSVLRAWRGRHRGPASGDAGPDGPPGRAPDGADPRPSADPRSSAAARRNAVTAGC